MNHFGDLLRTKPRITKVRGIWGIANSSTQLKTSWFFQALEWCRKRNRSTVPAVLVPPRQLKKWNEKTWR